MQESGGKLFVFTAILMFAILACNLPVSGSSRQEGSQPLPSSPSATPEVEDMPVSEQITATDQPEEARSDNALAGSPANPGAIGVNYEFESWDIMVKEYLRGLPALSKIRESRPDLPDPPAGWEYALVKMFVRCKIIDEYSHSLGMSDVYMLGNQGVSYSDRLMDIPERELVYSDFYAGEGDDTWLDALVPVDETGMMLVFTWPQADDTSGVTHFISLEPDAGYPSAEVEIPSGQLAGSTPQSATRLGQAAVVKGWEIQILEAVRGEQAFGQLKLTAELGKVFNFRDVPEPDAGMEYLVFHAKIRYTGQMPQNGLACFHQSDLKLIYGDGTEDGSRLLFMPPLPSLDGCYLPGGVRVGYGMGVAPIGDGAVVLAYPEFGERVYFSLNE